MNTVSSNLCFPYLHINHLPIFGATAKLYNCHILIRKTGAQSIHWIGLPGYTGKRGDMKANTANKDNGYYKLAGLVCSPYIHPEAFTPERREKAINNWEKCKHLITVPNNRIGFTDHQSIAVNTPYIVQTNSRHPHYGCVALVEMGLLRPRFVHGDYDLYAIIPAGRPFDPYKIMRKYFRHLVSTMSPEGLSQQEKEKLQVLNIEGELSFRVANTINLEIEKTSQDLLGALMVNHGEQINMGGKAIDFQPVLAVMPESRDGSKIQVLNNQQEHEEFYKNA